MKDQEYTRLTVSLRHDVHEVIARLAVLTEMPKSKVITGLLEESLPALRQVISALETAKASNRLDASLFEHLLDDSQKAIDEVRADIRASK